MNFQKTSLNVACAALLGLSLTGLGAQTLEGKASANGKMMTITELRNCIKQQDGLKLQRADFDKRRSALDLERVEISKDVEDIKPIREDVQARNAKIRAFNERDKEFSERVKRYEERKAEVAESGRSGPILDRQRRELEKEERELQSLSKAGQAESKLVVEGLEQAIAELTRRTEANQKRAISWNERNKQLESDASAYEDKRMDWSANCGGRRYREDDEKAIRAEMK